MDVEHQRTTHLRVLHHHRRAEADVAVFRRRFDKRRGGLVRPEFVFGEQAILVEVEFRPLRFRQRPFLGLLPLARILDEKLHRRLVHDAGIDALQPVVEPAQGLVGVLVHRPVEIVRRPDGQPARPRPVLERLDIARQVQTVHPPAAAEIAGNLYRRVAYGLLLVVLGVEIIDQVFGDHHVAALVGIVEHRDEFRMDVDFRVLERLLDLLVEGPHADAVAVLLADAQVAQRFQPVLVELEREDAAVEHGAAILVGGGEWREDRLQRRRLQLRHPLGGHGEVRRAAAVVRRPGGDLRHAPRGPSMSIRSACR